jgi:uncharacterized protein (PEP-CTERM system associated)
LKAGLIRRASRRAEGLRTRARGAGAKARAAGAALAAGLAAGAAQAETVRIVPSVTVTESYSDNVALVSSEFARAGWITDVAPAIRADLSGAKVKGSLVGRLDFVSYSSESRLNSRQQFLNSSAEVEAVDGWLFVDARADITQQNRSAFGAAVTPDLPSASANRVQTTSYQLAPLIRGHLSDTATYQFRLNETALHADDIALPDTQTTEWSGRVGNPSAAAKLRWAIDADGVSLRNDVVGKLEGTRVRGSLIYALDPDIHVSFIDGYETTDFAGPPARAVHTPGAGVEWSPGVRTRLSAVYEKRFFGRGYSVLFSHRTPLTAWRVVSHRDVAGLPIQLATGSLASIQSLMSDVLASAIPDLQARTQAVQRRLEQTGISGTSALNSSFVTTRPFVFRSDVASFVLLGRANTATLTATHREQRSFGVSLGGEGVVADEDFRQTGFNANLAHKLSPNTTLTFSATSLRTDGLTLPARQSRERMYTVFVSTRIGRRSSASLGIRRLDFEGSTAIESYRAHLIFGSVSIRL